MARGCRWIITPRVKNKSLFTQKEPIGTEEELNEAFEIMSEHLYKILSYAEKENITKEDVDKERRILTFCRQGPRAGHFRHTKKGKLTSAEVLYILTTSLPSTKLEEIFGVSSSRIRKIRRGEVDSWNWEYMFVKRIREIIRHKYRKVDQKNKVIYTIKKLIDIDRYENIYYTTSIRKAKKLREDMLSKAQYKKLVEDNELDIKYPIEKIEVLL